MHTFRIRINNLTTLKSPLILKMFARGPSLSTVISIITNAILTSKTIKSNKFHKSLRYLHP